MLNRSNLAAALSFAILPTYAAVVGIRDTTCQTSGAIASKGYWIVESGQTLWDVANTTGLGYCNIARYNRLADPELIYVGENITLPAQACDLEDYSCITKYNKDNAANCVLGAAHTYYTTPNDTIAKVARRFNINATALLANNERQGATSLDGALPELMNLKIPQCNNSVCAISPFALLGPQTFQDVCNEWGCEIGQLLAYNNGYNHSGGGIDGLHGPVLSLVWDCKLLPGQLDHSPVS